MKNNQSLSAMAYHKAGHTVTAPQFSDQEFFIKANQGIYTDDDLTRIVASSNLLNKVDRQDLRNVIEDVAICYLFDTVAAERETEEKRQIKNSRDHRRRMAHRVRLGQMKPRYTGNNPINDLIDRLVWVWLRFTGKEPGESINNNYRTIAERETEKEERSCGGPFIRFVLQVYEPLHRLNPVWNPYNREVAIRFRLKWCKAEQNKIPPERMDYLLSCPLPEFMRAIARLP